MTTLTMILCLIANHDQCRESKLQFHAISPYACAMRAQGEIAHPNKGVIREGEYVARYRCERAGVFARI